MLDNLRHVHDSPRLLRLLRRLRITPVFTPTEASWLNLIESHFGALKRATLTNSDDRDHATRQRRIYRYLRRRHRELGIRGHTLEQLQSIRGIRLGTALAECGQLLSEVRLSDAAAGMSV